MAETIVSNFKSYGADPEAAASPTPVSLLDQLVRGEAAAWPKGWPLAAEGVFLQTAAIHGVHLLAARSLKHIHGWPSSLVTGLQSQHESAKAAEVLKRAELEKVVDLFNKNGVRPLVLKGTALAYNLYPSPALRPRGDTDVLIPEEDVDTTIAIFVGLGYSMHRHSGGTHISTQRTLERCDQFGVLHTFDIHWKISNSPVFRELLQYDEMMERALPLSGVDVECAAVCPTDALLHACLHRLTHFHAPYYVGDAVHYGDRLIWLYDIHLLAQCLTSSQQYEFITRARDRGLATICSDGIGRAAVCFKTTGADDVLETLEATRGHEPAAALLTAGRLHRLMLELAAFPDLRARVAFISEHLFPPADYMKAKYDVRSSAWLPFLYLHRALHGIWKRMG